MFNRPVGGYQQSGPTGGLMGLGGIGGGTWGNAPQGNSVDPSQQVPTGQMSPYMPNQMQGLASQMSYGFGGSPQDWAGSMNQAYSAMQSPWAITAAANNYLNSPQTMAPPTPQQIASYVNNGNYGGAKPATPTVKKVTNDKQKDLAARRAALDKIIKELKNKNISPARRATLQAAREKNAAAIDAIQKR